MGSSLGSAFKITTWGESHGPAVGVVVDGCPPGVRVRALDIQRALDRRRPGQSRITTARAEPDQVEILSGVVDEVSLGTPIALLVQNQDQRSQDYAEVQDLYRPSHADYTYEAKYGRRAVAGGGRSSARETIGRVAAGAIAEQVLSRAAGVKIVGYVKTVAHLEATIDPQKVRRTQVDRTMVRCPDEAVAARMVRLIERAKKAGDSVGGVIECVARRVPPGLGEPVFDKLEADLARALMSLPAAKGFEIGSGFLGTRLRGSEHNDQFVRRAGRVRTRTNYSGGVQGGISNGEPIVVRVAFKPTATILKPQKTVGPGGRRGTLKPRGRHDPCVVPRAVPIVEAMVALVLCDHLMRQWMIDRFRELD